MALFGTFWPLFGVPFLDHFLVVITLFYRLGGKIDGPKSGQKGAKMAKNKAKNVTFFQPGFLAVF